MADVPAGALLLVLLARGVGTFAGGWLAARLAPRAPLSHAMIVGLILLAAGVMNMVMLPHPLWFWFPGVALFLPAAYAGAKLAAPGRAGDAR
jgi:predicted MFS family arabinose efflux permease